MEGRVEVQADGAAPVGAVEPLSITPPATAFFLSDMTIVAGWMLLAVVYVAEPAELAEYLEKPSDLLLVLFSVIAAFSALALVAMIVRRVRPGAFALRLDQHGVRWRDPYFFLITYRLKWSQVDYFHAPQSYGMFGTARIYREDTFFSSGRGPSPFDRSLPSNYGLRPKRLAQLLEERRRLATPPQA